MMRIGFDKKFSLLAQESYLAQSSLLSGFDFILKANLFQDKDGYFYSAFFHVAIGMERMLKLVVVTHYMLNNKYQTPTIKQLKGEFGHDIGTLYTESLNILPEYLPGFSNPSIPESDEQLIDFFKEYAIGSRYFNLNEICEEKQDRSPLYKWLDIARAIYENYTPHQIRHKSAMALIYRMDRVGPPNCFTDNLDEHGNPMMMFDCLYRQYVIQKSAPLVIWRLIEILQPIHFLLESMARKAANYEKEYKINSMVIPHYEDFFYFLLANKKDIKGRKSWMATFSS